MNSTHSARPVTPIGARTSRDPMPGSFPDRPAERSGT